MSIISDYILQVKTSIEKRPSVLSSKLIVDNRGDVVLYLKGEIVFTNQSELHFKEYIVSIPQLKKIAYSYHYQDAEKNMIFRHDNAEHHPELENFPHHKHVDQQTVSSEEVSLDDILDSIVNDMLNS
ncbi:MAG: hypothetical protein GTO45_31790 [Candidatus Aminicenantes bacterium]|nr:hypothetical protein [Candidatus Aminicenantes bacterium]NIM83355.1 hypothetical protein [Candidatus Aminicenantes bacterium]NIN22719.1 hypothetical protein [Candidatus Aminicenantes bacterium]NIN46479.1 hypothetical protein [Candidatus Aminicenantes bacterium]NIN89361.1 hypothetical protein [Candidatus Aminicenantes bacterium]